MEDQLSHQIRIAVFEWLQIQAPITNHVMTWEQLSRGFTYKGEVITLIGAKGIWKPKQIKEFPISITSTEKSVYDDQFISNDQLHYSYRGTNINHSDNIGLRNAMKDSIPLIYLHQVTKGKYFVAWPVFVIDDDPGGLTFTVSAESTDAILNKSMVSEPIGEYRRKYQTREIVVRLHQASFRERVLSAYKNHCSICRLKHISLLDAAHIVPDGQGGLPEVTNGLSLCKIHHAAYDQNIIGISPDYEVIVRNDILHEVDGPMLKYCIQSVDKSKLILPRSEKQHPNKEYLDWRYQRFKNAG